MIVKELIAELQKIENQDKYIHLLGNRTNGEDEDFDIIFNNIEVWDDCEESITLFTSVITELDENHIPIEINKDNMNKRLKTNLIILEMVKELKFNSEDNIDTLDIIPIALEIGEYNNIYNDGNWSNDERNDCYNKAYEIINNN